MVWRESSGPEVLGADPGGAPVDEGVLRMEVAISLHDIRAADEPANIDAGRQQTAHDSVFVLFDAADWRAVEQDSDPHAPSSRRGENRRDPLALKCVDADLDGRTSGTEESEQGQVARIRREDRGRRTPKLERSDVEHGLAQPMVSDAFPVLCRIAVDPSAGEVSTSNRDFPTPHPFGRATDPPCPH